MAQNGSVGRVAALWRFPVKSMRGERLDRAEITLSGLPGDRGFALVDQETQRVVSAVNFKRYPNLFAFRARYLESPEAGQELPAVAVELPDGREVRSDSGDADALISEQLGCAVRLVRSAGKESSVDGTNGPFHDAAPVSVLTNSTLRTMNELQPESVFDARRFRMNLILDCDETGFPENAWVGRVLNVGNGVRLAVTSHDARCVMTTLAQDDLPEDRGILSGLARHNRIQMGGKGRYPCAGVYAQVLSAGAAAEGDNVGLAGE